MSLINEALKKAERERAMEAAEGTTSPHGGRGRVAKRGAPMRTQTVLTIAAGALLLIVVSAVLTGVFVTRTVEPKPAARQAGAPTAAGAAPVLILAKIPSAPDAQQPAAGAAPAATPPARTQAPQSEPFSPSAFRSETAGPANTAAASAAAIVANLPAVGSAAPAAPFPAAPEPPPASPSGPPAGHPAPSPAASTAAAPASQAPAAPPRHDPRVQALVDGFHVTGIRSNGQDSKVLMNERVFRVNDIVDYGLGLRLTAVAPDRLTFVDAGGETYLKNF